MNLSSRRRARPEDASKKVADEVVKAQVRKQLSTTLDATLGQGRDFEVNSSLKSYASSVAGTQSLHDYEQRRGAEERLDELRRAGLTEHEIGLFLQHGLDGGRDHAIAAAKKSRTVATDEAVRSRLSLIKEKLSSRSDSSLSSWQLDLSNSAEDNEDTDRSGAENTSASKATLMWKPPEEIMSQTRSSSVQAASAPEVDSFVPPTKSGQGPGNSSLLPQWQEVKHVRPAGVVLPKTAAALTPPLTVTREEIEVGRMSVTAIRQLPKFENYEPGEPNQILYVKNLAANTTHGDLLAVFSAACEGHLDSAATAAAGPLHVRLMKKGKLRGQAFVTFPSLEGAKAGLAAVNGYILHGKPMIIQYGRTPATTNAATSTTDTSSDAASHLDDGNGDDEGKTKVSDVIESSPG
eukprot:scpid56196/ scgid24512/ RNA-binding protein 41; RNA-binding motif protein 41